MQYSPTYDFTLFIPNIFLSTLSSKSLGLCSYLNVRDKISHIHKTAFKITYLTIDENKEGFLPNGSKALLQSALNFLLNQILIVAVISKYFKSAKF
jgi:hypothetical protein